MTDTNPSHAPAARQTTPPLRQGWPTAVLAIASESWGLDAAGSAQPLDRPAAADMRSELALTGTSGVFNPVGHLMVGLPLPSQLRALVRLLRGAGWPADMVLRFDVEQAQPDTRAMAASARVMAGLDFQIALLRRYLSLSRDGYGWLLVRAEDARRARAVAALARDCGARVAVHYRGQSIEELIV
jgi:hypothetical protein